APFRDFASWLATRDREAAARYWRRQLSGVTGPTVLDLGRPGPGRGHEDCLVPLAPGVGHRVAAYARSRRVTVNTVMQGAWAVLMSRYAGTGDVLFGVVSSGRGGQVAGIDTMVGLLMNTTVARVQVDPGQDVGTWLGDLQAAQARAREF